MRRTLFLLCMALAQRAVADTAGHLHRYRVELDSALSTLKVQACFDGKAPPMLVAESLDASTALKSAHFDGSRKNLEPNGTELKLPLNPSAGCLHYEVDITPAAMRHERGGTLTGLAGEDVIVDLGQWFWRPDQMSADDDIQIEFLLPPGIVVSTPWRREEGVRSEIYRVGHTPADWPALIAFGRFTEHTVNVPGATLQVVVLGVTPKIHPEVIVEWIRNAALGVTTAYGRFPVPSARVLVVPNAQGEEPVPWAFVQRGGRPSAQFLINHRLPSADFLADWTLFHELAHMLLPYISSQDAWLSEGFASYYQNVLRARRGVIAPLDAWQRMHAGFERGRKSQVGTTLADATERMYRNAGYMRVYWQGAAIALMADYELRLRTQGRQNLDSALAGLAKCCLPSDVSWRARDVLKRLDDITQTTVFTDLHDRFIASEAFPDLSEVYAGLGLTVSNKEVRFVDATHSAWRDAMMKGTQ